jgi:hypothetical protein
MIQVMRLAQTPDPDQDPSYICSSRLPPMEECHVVSGSKSFIQRGFDVHIHYIKDLGYRANSLRKDH